MATNVVCPCCSKQFLGSYPIPTLQKLCEENKYVEVCELINTGNNVNIILYPSYQTPLHVAAIANSKEALTVLLIHGAIPDICNRDGWTALHEAVQRKHLEIAQILLEFCATPCECHVCQNALQELQESEDEEMDFEKELEKLRPVLQGKLVNKLGEIIDINK